MNEKILKIYNNVQIKYSNEVEYLDSVKEFLESVSDYVLQNQNLLDQKILERLLIPERVIMFRVPWLDDQGIPQVNIGYRVQFNSAIGPYKGGLRFDKTVNLSILKFLGFEQTFKNALTGLNLGGGKGGSDFDPKGKSDNEVMRFCQSFMTELYKFIGPDEDVPAGDIGVGAREIGYLFGQYKRLTNTFCGVLTGKRIEFGGSYLRPEATGYGLCYFGQAMLKKMKNTSFKDKKVIISGSGNVAIYTLDKVCQLGGKVVAMSDSEGTIYNENGLSFSIIKELKENHRLRIKEYLKYDDFTTYFPNSKTIWSIKCDIALPCATQHELDLSDAKQLVNNGCFAIIEGANMPCTLDACQYFINNKILFGPSKAANAGGVMVSGFEMSQNSMRKSWSLTEVDHLLKSQMERIFEEIYTCSYAGNNTYDLIKGANIVAFKKVSTAMMAQGLV